MLLPIRAEYQHVSSSLEAFLGLAISSTTQPLGFIHIKAVMLIRAYCILRITLNLSLSLQPAFQIQCDWNRKASLDPPGKDSLNPAEKKPHWIRLGKASLDPPKEKASLDPPTEKSLIGSGWKKPHWIRLSKSLIGSLPTFSASLDPWIQCDDKSPDALPKVRSVRSDRRIM